MRSIIKVRLCVIVSLLTFIGVLLCPILLFPGLIITLISCGIAARECLKEKE